MTPEQFTAIADALPEAMMLVVGDGQVLAVNRATGETLGLGLQRTRGRPVWELVEDPPEDVRHYLRLCARSRHLVFGSLRLRLDDGRTMVCRAEGTLVRPRTDDDEALVLLRLIPRGSASGQFAALNLRLAALDREIRRRRKSEETAYQQAERWRVTLFSIGDAAIVTDSECRVDTMNPVAQSLTGWTQAEAQGRPLQEVFRIVNQNDRRPVDNPAERVIREGVIVGLANHTILIARNGTERPIDDSAAPIRDRRGHIIGAVLVFRDVTDRREIEAALRESDRRKDEFLALLAHELRNPLAPIRNGLQIMRLAGGAGEATQFALPMMERQLGHMVRLIDDLLDVSRISQGRIELRRQTIEIATVISTALEASSPVIEEHGHDVEATLADEAIYVDADSTRLAQALGNLLVNAAKFTAPGGCVRIGLRREGSEAVVTVRDNGIGIPAPMLPRVFDLFTQIDRSRGGANSGLGIGLSIVKRLVELHDGSVEAHSEGQGKGSTFTLRLPVSPPPVDDGRPHGPAVREGPRARRRIVVAEDNEDSASSLATLLTLLGHEVHVARDGLEAVEAALRYLPDIVLLDIGMPNLDGYGACRRIRETWPGGRLLLVAMTGWGQDEDKRRAREAGFDHHLIKPVEPEALEQLLNSLPGGG